MKISIITVTCNSASTIERCVNSVQSQTYSNIEQIFIDNCSSDGTMHIIKTLATSADVIISERDNGIYDAMNKGLKIASGNIICFLNSDDLYAENSILEKIAAKMQSDNLDALSTDVSYFKKGYEKTIIRKFNSGHFSPNRFKFGIMPAHPGLFLRSEIVKKTGYFNTSYKIAGDFEYLIRVYKNKMLSYQHCSLVSVLMQAGGVSNASFGSRMLINKEMLRACAENNIKTNYLNICFKYLFKVFEIRLTALTLHMKK